MSVNGKATINNRSGVFSGDANALPALFALSSNDTPMAVQASITMPNFKANISASGTVSSFMQVAQTIRDAIMPARRTISKNKSKGFGTVKSFATTAMSLLEKYSPKNKTPSKVEAIEEEVSSEGEGTPTHEKPDIGAQIDQMDNSSELEALLERASNRLRRIQAMNPVDVKDEAEL